MTLTEQAHAVTMKGNPVVLLGNNISVGQAAPDATVVANDLSEVKLSSFKGKKIILSIVPSLDTPVCDLQTRRFNEEAGKIGNDVKVLTVSMDLPFAQKRWCGTTNCDKVTTLSDYRYASLGEAYGVLIKGLRLLARAVFIIDTAGKVQYKEVVKEITTHPDYDTALKAFKNIN